jgi:predicted DCC family thiol-disulfide oxidoreductase YuxK
LLDNLKTKPVNGIILFDGVCNFCNGSVNFIIERDQKSYFKFAPLQSETGQEMLDKYGIDKTETDSVILIEDEKAYTHSTAALKIARRLDGAWSLLYAFIAVPRPLRDFFYRVFARYRYKLFGRRDACMMPTPDIRARFLG